MLTGKELWTQVTKEFKNSPLQLSSYSSYAFRNDMKHFLFTLSRYKFASKMIENRKDLILLELGCNDGIGTKIFEQTGTCKRIIGVDFDADAISWAQQNNDCDITTFINDDFIGREYVNGGADVIISLDVIEHIDMASESVFLDTIDLNLKKDGVVILGTPNITMSPYASEGSKIAHVNLYDQKRLYTVLSKKFHNVFIFGMNDEVIQTGFYPMSCYILAICTGKK